MHLFLDYLLPPKSKECFTHKKNVWVQINGPAFSPMTSREPSIIQEASIGGSVTASVILFKLRSNKANWTPDYLPDLNHLLSSNPSDNSIPSLILKRSKGYMSGMCVCVYLEAVEIIPGTATKIGNGIKAFKIEEILDVVGSMLVFFYIADCRDYMPTGKQTMRRRRFFSWTSSK